MAGDRRAQLQRIRTFPSLIAYLRNELDWPIDSDDFEELTFEYTPEELGIDSASAAKIQEIKRLRRLTPTQPWGIFFVKFEPKQLPVVALRRILSRVVVKKRASANSADRAVWAADDLLFVSNYGESDARQISFAHFSQDESRLALPVLKVLGWDNQDTQLHLDHIVDTLHEHLSWPADEADTDDWRANWRGAFTLRHREVVTTSKALAERLAELARAIRDRISTALAIETKDGPLTTLMNTFREALVHDLDEDGFADMYAQTIAYGLLSARIANPGASTADDFAGHMRTNPFLRELMESFMSAGGRAAGDGDGQAIDFDELGVGDVVQLLDDANMEAVLRDFGNRNPDEDPVIHFYELFLKEYDAKKRMQRGVFYTPRPIVSYIVGSVDELLRVEYGLEDGLADTTTWGDMVRRDHTLQIPEGVDPSQTFVQILDPATGTGTFLVEVIEVIHRRLTLKWEAQGATASDAELFWNDYVPEHLLPRLHGYELLMAPYAIAHLKVGLKLYETGYHFGSEERARIYLTNALEPAHDSSGQFEFAIPALAHEAKAVNDIKRSQRFTVIVGNPPYSNFGQLNKNPTILAMLDDYKRDLGEKKLNLDDDFIKFVRFSQHLLDETGAGLLGMITNNAFFDGPTHRRMRQSLLASFGTLRAINLHGSYKKGEKAPDGTKDENVFDITVGVGISLLAKAAGSPPAVGSDLWGLRPTKYAQLSQTTPLALTELTVEAPNFYFVPKDLSLSDEYFAAPSVPEIFQAGISGIKTHRDGLVVDFQEDTLARRFLDIAQTEDLEVLKARFGIEDTDYWTLAHAKAHIEVETVASKVHTYFYRPFDVRYLFYEPKIIERGDARWNVMRHMLEPNLALICTRQTNPGPFTEVLVANTLVDKRALASFTGEARAYPLYAYDDVATLSFDGADAGARGRRPNLSPAFLKTLSRGLGLAQQGVFGLPEGVTPEDMLHYAYAVFHGAGFRNRYAEHLRIDYPRLPVASDLALFQELAAFGAQLVALHLMQPDITISPAVKYVGPETPAVGRIGWSDETVWLDAGATKKGRATVPGTVGFQGVRETVWDLQLGGYQVCEKWLKDRKGRSLSADDIAHYQKIVVALGETIRLMAEIDDVIDAHGGWPDAFGKSA